VARHFRKVGAVASIQLVPQAVSPKISFWIKPLAIFRAAAVSAGQKHLEERPDAPRLECQWRAVHAARHDHVGEHEINRLVAPQHRQRGPVAKIGKRPIFNAMPSPWDRQSLADAVALSRLAEREFM
jgi:hypothetical protein